MREATEKVIAFGASFVTTTYLLGLVAYCFWQSLDAVGVVIVGMSGITILVLVSCELQDRPGMRK